MGIRSAIHGMDPQYMGLLTVPHGAHGPTACDIQFSPTRVEAARPGLDQPAWLRPWTTPVTPSVLKLTMGLRFRFRELVQDFIPPQTCVCARVYTRARRLSCRVSHQKWLLPWLLWLSGWSAGLRTKRSLVGFPVRAHAWLRARSPVGGA